MGGSDKHQSRSENSAARSEKIGISGAGLTTWIPQLRRTWNRENMAASCRKGARESAKALSVQHKAVVKNSHEAPPRSDQLVYALAVRAAVLYCSGWRR